MEYFVRRITKETHHGFCNIVKILYSVIGSKKISVNALKKLKPNNRPNIAPTPVLTDHMHG